MDIKKMQKKIKKIRALRGITLNDLENVFIFDWRVLKRIEEGEMNVMVPSLIEYLNIIDCELTITPKKTRRQEKEMEAINNALGFDFSPLLNKANKKAP